jgi:two-component system, OmpR family, heavy metal sensor histidine kinase CusS
MSSSRAAEPLPGRSRPGRSLVSRLTALYAVAASLVLLVAVLAVYRELVTDIDREDDQLLRENVLLVDAMLLKPPPDPRQALLDLEGGRRQLGAKRVLIRILDGDGQVVVATPGMAAELPREMFPPPMEPADESIRGITAQRGDSSYRLLTAQLESTVLGGPEACVQIALDRRDEHKLLARYRNLLLLVTIPGLLASAFIGQRLARRAIRPVQEVAADIARIHASSLDARMSTQGLVTELRPLVVSFNGLLGRLEESFDRLRSFSAHLAHELRTPIHNLCGEIEVALSGARPAGELAAVLRSCSEEAQSLSHIVEGLLFLAYAERPGALIAREPVDVGAVVDGVVEFYEPAAAEAGIALCAVTARGPALALDRTMLQRALGNLLSNAIAFTPRGGTITVTTRWRDSVPEIEVVDTGCGIQRERLATIFDGLYRNEDVLADSGPRVGLGLGLTIVRSILRLHGGTVTIDSDLGKGCRVTMRFGPRAAAG